MTKRMYLVLIASLLILAYSCKKEKKDDKGYTYHKVVPAEFPNLDIPGFSFPQDSVTLNQWIHNSEDAKIQLHGWGIWTGLTSKTDQYIGDQKSPLLVYETWLTPGEIIDIINGVPVKRSNRANLNKPHQFTHNKAKTSDNDVSDSESVAYSPAAANFAVEKKIFKATTLAKMAREGMTDITPFPNNAITIKPVFKVLETSSGATSFQISAWNGTTDKLEGFGQSKWNSYVTVDISDNPPSGSYSVNDFIHYQLNDEDAYYFNKEFDLNAQPGDYAILMAMHVGTREISNWTWQTFWWDKSPDNPPLPSSKTIADARPDALKGASRHYAMAQAYYMINPKEPYDGTDVIGEPNFAFNPYLEAHFSGFGAEGDTLSVITTPGGEKIKTYVGVRTNCMSCHRMASIDAMNLDNIGNPNKNSNTPYVGDSFVSRNDSVFNGQLKVDFAWSIQGNIDTLGLAAYKKSLQK